MNDHPKLNLTPDEKRYFGQLFKQTADKNDGGVVTGEEAYNLLVRSGLSNEVLGKIWDLLDTEGRGLLTSEDFIKALRLVGLAQSQPGRELRLSNALQPGALPRFEGIPAPTTAPPPGASIIPQLSPENATQYAQLFQSRDLDNGFISGETARAIFQASGLSDDVLLGVWNLADTEQRGALSEVEFVVAMHLIVSMKNKLMTQLPRAIPPPLWNAATRRFPAGSTPTTAIPRQVSGPQAQRTGSPLTRPPGAGAPPAFSWRITPEERSNFDRLFATIDPQNLGQVGGDQAANLFRHSNLPDDVLADVWTLANIRNSDALDRDEFAIAMKLINSQRGKGPNFDLPRTLPPELVPPNLRQYVAGPQPTSFPAPAQPQQPRRAPTQSSATEDLFGLDALTTSQQPPILQQQGTGGSAAAARQLDADPFGSKTSSPTSSTFQPRGNFKPFIPTSSFGQNLQTQNTGGSGTAAAPATREVKSPSAMDDLLGDNDPEVSRKLTNETAELANMSNQIGQLRTQMQHVQNDRAATEKDVTSTSSQRRDLELRLSQFRKQYDAEVEAVKALQQQLALSRRESQALQKDIAMLEGTTRDLQNQHQQTATELETEKRNNAALKERLTQLNAETARLKPEIEDMRNQVRHQKGLVSINKKQLEKGEAERDAMKAEMNRLTQERDQAAAAASRSASAVTSPAPSTASQGNPFARRSPQPSYDNTMSPAGFARGSPQTTKESFDNIFGAFSPPSQTSIAPQTSFGYGGQAEQPVQSASITSSSEPGPPTPSASPPASSHRDSPRTAEPPELSESRQLTPGDLPLRPGRQFSGSTATSVRVETPSSRLEDAGAETPTGQPAPPPLERLETNKSDGSTGAALFGRNKSTSPPPGSSGAGGKQMEDIFGKLPSSVPGAFPGTETSSVNRNITGDSSFSSGSRENTFHAFGKEPIRTATGSSSRDFDEVFSQSRPSTSGPKANGSGEAAVERIHSEFPPIPSLPEDEESDGDQGFDDDFIHPSPDQKKAVREEPPTPNAQQSPPSYGETVSPGGGARDANQFPPEFGGLLPSRENPTSAPQPAQSPSQGEALFGGKPPSSPPAFETTSSSNAPSSDVYHSAPSQQSAPLSTSHPPQHHRVSSFDDDFDEGFENLEEAKPDEEGHDDDDDILYSSAQENSFEFNPNFDSPAASKANTLGSERTPTNRGHASSRTDDSMSDFQNVGVNSGTSVSNSTNAPFGGSSVGDNWDSMMRSGTLPQDGPPTLSSQTGLESTKPNLERSMSEASEHDAPALKRLMQLGYPRSMALRELEKYDYDEDKVRTSRRTTTPKASPSGILDRPLPLLPPEGAEDAKGVKTETSIERTVTPARRPGIFRKMTRKLTRT